MRPRDSRAGLRLMRFHAHAKLLLLLPEHIDGHRRICRLLDVKEDALRRGCLNAAERAAQRLCPLIGHLDERLASVAAQA